MIDPSCEARGWWDLKIRFAKRNVVFHCRIQRGTDTTVKNQVWLISEDYVNTRWGAIISEEVSGFVNYLAKIQI